MLPLFSQPPPILVGHAPSLLRVGRREEGSGEGRGARLGDSTFRTFLRKPIPPGLLRSLPHAEHLWGEEASSPKPHQGHEEDKSPGTCRARRGRSRRARRACHPGPCRPPAAGTPSPEVSSTAHTAYLRRERGVNTDVKRSVWARQGTGDRFAKGSPERETRTPLGCLCWDLCPP